MAVLLSIYGFLDLGLLLVAALSERVKSLLGVTGNRNYTSSKGKATQRMRPLGGSAMRSTRANSKGQVTIPAGLRERFGIEKGTHLHWKEDQGRLVLTPMTQTFFQKLQGILKPATSEASAFEESFAERARERYREDLKYDSLLARLRAEKIEVPVVESPKKKEPTASRKRARHR